MPEALNSALSTGKSLSSKRSVMLLQIVLGILLLGGLSVLLTQNQVRERMASSKRLRVVVYVGLGLVTLAVIASIVIPLIRAAQKRYTCALSIPSDSINPIDAVDFSLLHGTAALKQSNFDQAISDYSWVINSAKRDIRRAYALNNLTCAYLARATANPNPQLSSGDIKLAEEAISAAISNAPTYCAAAYNFTLVYIVDGRSSDAQTAIQRVDSCNSINDTNWINTLSRQVRPAITQTEGDALVNTDTTPVRVSVEELARYNKPKPSDVDNMAFVNFTVSDCLTGSQVAENLHVYIEEVKVGTIQLGGSLQCNEMNFSLPKEGAYSYRLVAEMTFDINGTRSTDTYRGPMESDKLLIEDGTFFGGVITTLDEYGRAINDKAKNSLHFD